MSNILEVSGLEKNYESFKLNSINFSIEEHCIAGFIGINGSGKTTTIKSILGQVLKDSGEIKFFGKKLESNHAEIKNRVGIVLDEGYFYDFLTIKEMKNIIAPSYINWNEDKFIQYMNRFELNQKQVIGTLSKGMRMKFAISIALSHCAEFLIMDEPTSGLDPLIRNELMNILLEFIDDGGKGVFFSTHITSDLEKVADKLIFIDKGEIIFDIKKDTLMNTHRYIKGKKYLLNNKIKEYFINFKDYGDEFEGIITDKSKFDDIRENIVMKKLTIEEIMLAYIESGAII